MSHEFKCKITIEVTLEVRGKYFPGRPMSFYDRHGDPGSPAEPASLSLEKASISFGDYTFDVSDLRKWTEQDYDTACEYIDEQESSK